MERRWVWLAISIFVSTCCAINYAFGVLTDTLKDKFGFSQSQVDTIGTCGNVGQYFGLFAGLAYDKYGPRLNLAVGGVLIAVGYTLMYLALSETIPNPSLGMIGVFYAIGSNSQPWLDTASVVTNIHNFPNHRGLVVGLGKSFNGLGASVFGLIYSGAFSPDAVSYLLFIAIVPTAIAWSAITVAARVGDTERTAPVDAKSLYMGYATTVVLAVFMAAVAISDSYTDIPRSIKLVLVALLAVFYAPYLFMPVRAARARQYRQLDEGSGDPNFMSPLAGVRENDGLSSDFKGAGGRNTITEEHGLIGNLNVWAAMRTPEFYLVFVTIFVISGSGLSTINNVAQLQEALNGGTKSDSMTGVFVSIIATGSCAGRLMGGAIAAYYEKDRAKWIRLLGLSSALSTLAALWIALAPQVEMLYGSCLMAGVGFGMLWAVLPPLCADLYGLEGLGGIYNMLNFAPMTGSLTLATALTGSLYDKESDSQGQTGDDPCVGLACFQKAFLILSALGVLGFGCVVVVYVRNYQGLDLRGAGSPIGINNVDLKLDEEAGRRSRQNSAVPAE